MGQSVSRNDFIWTYTEQPHLNRRTAIVKAHPEIEELFGIDASFKYVVITMALFQIFMCWLLQDADWPLILLEAYLCGGVINHAMTLAIHDISHNTAFGNKYPLTNRFFGMVANLPIGVPISVSFKKYHVEHHRYLEGSYWVGLHAAVNLADGVTFDETAPEITAALQMYYLYCLQRCRGFLKDSEDGLDTDVPTELEAQLFTTPCRKFLWLLFQPLFYAFRPLVIYKKAPTDLEIVNAFIQILFDIFILHFFGYRSFAYLIIGTLVAMGVHPSAGHFISEHYVFKEDQETYSYYGPWNLCTFNVGYHVEHHDFPYIPGKNLPKVTEIAPEFYHNLHKHSSWTKVLFDFVFSPNMGPYMRLKRKASVPQTFKARHALNEYYQALLQHIGIKSLMRFVIRWLDIRSNKKNID